MKRAVLALVAVLGLAGCVAIPDAGPVVEGDVDTSEQSSNLIFIAPDPEPGATQEEIVLGFLAAAITPGDDFAIAREYLTEEASANWDPDARVIVRTGAQPEVALTGERSATASLTALSEVGPAGALELSGGDRLLEFELALVAGEWRIAAAPDGIVLSSTRFGQLFRAHTLHWFTADGSRTVPEVRWFERTAATLAERIIDAVLAGPSSWLAPAVTTAAAVETQRVGPPRADGTTMTVTLDFAQVEQRGSASLAPLAAQLSLSLRDLGVREVRVQVAGLDGLVASSNDAAPVDDGSVDQRPLVLEGDVLHSVGAGDPYVDPAGAALAAMGATNYTVGDAGGVAHTGATAAWIAPDAEPVVISTDVSVVPTVDDRGWVLLHEHASAGRLLAWHGDERSELSLPPVLGTPAAMEFARDGTRLAVVTDEGGGSAVWVMAVERDDDGTPVALGEPFPLPSIEGVATDITWVSPTQVAVLATDEGRTPITVLAVGGAAEPLPTPDGEVLAIVGGSEGIPTLRALDAEGAVLMLRGRLWSATLGLGPVALIATQQ